MTNRTVRNSATWVIVALSTTLLDAQGSRVDYDRAANLSRLLTGKVYRDRVRPQWLAGGQRFWYSNELRDGKREFILVDAVSGTRGPAFEPEKLALALSKATGTQMQPERLPLKSIDFSEDCGTLRFRSEGKGWSCNLETYELLESSAETREDSRIRLRRVPRATRETGPETSLHFVNRLDLQVELFWLDTNGVRKSYGPIRPEAEHRQHTFQGHVWIVVGPDDKVVAAFQAGDSEETAIIDDTVELESRRPSRSPRREGGGLESPDGKWLATFQDNNVTVKDTESGEEFPLSDDGTAEDGYSGRVFWSPDSKYIVAIQTKSGDERKVHYVESSPRDQLQPKLHSYDYLKPGDRIRQPRPRLFDVAARTRIPVSDELFSNPWSVSDIRWARDSSRFTFTYNQRGHQVLRIIAVSAPTGEARAIIDEQSETFVDYAHKQFSHPIESTDEIIWMSERDGWNHLYLYDAAQGEVKTQITQGEWVVLGVDRVDEDERRIWFRAGGIHPGQDPYYVHFCRVDFDGTGLTVLTEGDGTHSIEFSPDRRFFIDTWSRVDLPPVTELRRTEDGALVRELERADESELIATGWKAPERFVAKGRDGITDIFGVIFRPTDFNPDRAYAVVEEIYAGPQGAFVPKSFRSLHGPQAIAELGFIVVKIDGMGTSHRSKAFHDVCWKNLGDSGFPDRIAWLRAAAAKYPHMDLSRVGIYGGSAGGQSALRALLAHGDFYKVAVADCGCHDNRMDKIWWNELWMGWPIGPHYEEQSNVTQAHRLQGKLLLVVGEMDENVDPASTLQVVAALVRADKDFDLLVMPGTGHGAAESAYGKRRRADFLVRHLLGVEPRWIP